MTRSFLLTLGEMSDAIPIACMLTLHPRGTLLKIQGDGALTPPKWTELKDPEKS